MNFIHEIPVLFPPAPEAMILEKDKWPMKQEWLQSDILSCFIILFLLLTPASAKSKDIMWSAPDPDFTFEKGMDDPRTRVYRAVNCGGCCSTHDGVCCIRGETMCCDGTQLNTACKVKGCDACMDAVGNDSGEDSGYSGGTETDYDSSGWENDTEPNSTSGTDTTPDPIGGDVDYSGSKRDDLTPTSSGMPDSDAMPDPDSGGCFIHNLQNESLVNGL